MKEGDKIFWPPDESFAMTVLGFDEVKEAAKQIVIDGDLSIEVASLDGIFILKLFAWYDRHHKHNRDANDMAFIINNYLSIFEERAATKHYDKIYLTEDFSPNTAGAKLLGIDMSEIIKEKFGTKERIIKILRNEIEKVRKASW